MAMRQGGDEYCLPSPRSRLPNIYPYLSPISDGLKFVTPSPYPSGIEYPRLRPVSGLDFHCHQYALVPYTVMLHLLAIGNVAYPPCMDSPTKKTFDIRDTHIHGSTANSILLIKASHQVEPLALIPNIKNLRGLNTGERLEGSFVNVAAIIKVVLGWKCECKERTLANELMRKDRKEHQ
ncbi:hypothetical protein HKD37_20G056275 [Glycine soja]